MAGSGLCALMVRVVAASAQKGCDRPLDNPSSRG